MTKNELKQLVSRIVLSQGNRYIKEYLRDLGVTIGTNKDDFERNLHIAIDDDEVTEDDLLTWLDAVEGWGAQHIYMFNAPVGPAVAGPQQFAAAVEGSALAALFNADNRFAFPQEMELTSIRSIQNGYSFEWHQDTSEQRRFRARDYEEEDGGRTFLYKAFLIRSSRSMIRLEYEFGRPFCAIFLQIAKDENAHNEAMQAVQDTFAQATGTAFPNVVPLNGAVNVLRNRQAGLTTSYARFDANGGSVLLRADVEGGIRAVAPVRQVGNAVTAQDFPSASGAFGLQNPADANISRLKFEVAGVAGRISIRAQTTREAIYGLMEYVWDAMPA